VAPPELTVDAGAAGVLWTTVRVTVTVAAGAGLEELLPQAATPRPAAIAAREATDRRE